MPYRYGHTGMAIESQPQTYRYLASLGGEGSNNRNSHNPNLVEVRLTAQEDAGAVRAANRGMLAPKHHCLCCFVADLVHGHQVTMSSGRGVCAACAPLWHRLLTSIWPRPRSGSRVVCRAAGISQQCGSRHMGTAAALHCGLCIALPRGGEVLRAGRSGRHRRWHAFVLLLPQVVVVA
jgi:hypothetical protein